MKGWRGKLHAGRGRGRRWAPLGTVLIAEHLHLEGRHEGPWRATALSGIRPGPALGNGVGRWPDTAGEAVCVRVHVCALYVHVCMCAHVCTVCIVCMRVHMCVLYVLCACVCTCALCVHECVHMCVLCAPCACMCMCVYCGYRVCTCACMCTVGTMCVYVCM